MENLYLDQGHNGALPVRESNQGPATFRSLTQCSATDLSPPQHARAIIAFCEYLVRLRLLKILVIIASVKIHVIRAQILRSRDKYIIARPPGWFLKPTKFNFFVLIAGIFSTTVLYIKLNFVFVSAY